MIAPMAVGATSAFGGLFAARAVTVSLNMAPSKVKNENPDDFATYLAKRQVCASLRQTRCRPCARNPCFLSPTRDDLLRSPPVRVGCVVR